MLEMLSFWYELFFFANLCFWSINCVVVKVVKNLPEYLLWVRLQTHCRLGELKGVKCESAKMKKTTPT